MRPSFKSFLIEGISNVIYHHTNLNSIKSILEDNIIKLSSTMAKSIEKDYTKKYFYLSTTRSRVGAYHYSHGSAKPLHHTMALLKLDGRRLSDIVSGGPIDYWGKEFRKNEPANHEMEDRIVSDKPIIQNAKKYILSVECFLDKNTRSNNDNYWINPLRDIINLCLERGITVNLYLNYKEFIAGKKAIQNEEALAIVNEHGPELERYNREKLSSLEPYIELLTTDKKEDLSQKASKILFNIGHNDYELQNEIRRFQADFHNENKHDDSRKLTMLAQKFKLYSLKDVLLFIRNKFKK